MLDLQSEATVPLMGNASILVVKTPVEIPECTVESAIEALGSLIRIDDRVWWIVGVELNLPSCPVRVGEFIGLIVQPCTATPSEADTRALLRARLDKLVYEIESGEREILIRPPFLAPSSDLLFSTSNLTAEYNSEYDLTGLKLEYTSCRPYEIALVFSGRSKGCLVFRKCFLRSEDDLDPAWREFELCEELAETSVPEMTL